MGQINNTFLFFDTETTGLPQNWKAPMTDLGNWPRVIQLAAALFDIDGNQLNFFELLIEPNGWTMPNGQFWIDNGFSQEKSIKDGVPIKDTLELFIKYHDQSDYMVAHNMSYDYNVLGAEMIRSGLKCSTKTKHLCTKEIGTTFCGIPGPYGLKWPKLSELHYELFGSDFEGAHQASTDVEATAKCFFELLKRGVVKLDP